MSEENVEVVRRVFARLDELVGSVGPEEIEARLSDAVLEELYDPDVEWVPVPQGLLAGRSYVGYEGLRRFWADFVSTWDEYVAEPREFLDVANDLSRRHHAGLGTDARTRDRRGLVRYLDAAEREGRTQPGFYEPWRRPRSRRA
jgi:hypothetical protein